MARIFICYRREDTRADAGRLHDRLRDYFGEKEVFMDLTIEPGDDWVDVIENTVGACDAVVAMIGPAWATIKRGDTRRLDDPTDHVRRELVAALARRVRIIPTVNMWGPASGRRDPH